MGANDRISYDLPCYKSSSYFLDSLLTLSAGEFHSEFLDWDHIGNIAQVHYRTFNRPLGIDFEYTSQSSQLVEQFYTHMNNMGIGEKCFRLNLRTSFANVGRMKDNYSLYQLNEKKAISADKLICRPESLFTIEPDGNVLPCCGYNRFIKGIVLGNINDESVERIISNANNHRVINLLLNNNFMGIQKELFGADNSLPTQYRSNCEACEVCFGKGAESNIN